MSVNINGVHISDCAGRNIIVSNNRVIVDGTDITDRIDKDVKNIVINIAGDVESLKVDRCGTISVTGNAKTISTVSGDIECNEVSGNINTTSGDLKIRGSVGGSINTVSGDVECGTINGSVSTMSGDISKR